MLILFDFENIQNVHYQAVRRLIIENYGKKDWDTSVKIGAVAIGNEMRCLKDWNSNVKIFRVEKKPQAADQKLIEVASQHGGNRCIIVTNDVLLFESVREARIQARMGRVSNNGLKKTKTAQIHFENGVLKINCPSPNYRVLASKENQLSL